MTSAARDNVNKLRNFVSVRDFGADNTGVFDVSAAIIAAIASFPATETAAIWFPSGVYRLDTKVTLTRPSIIYGNDATILANTGSFCFEVDNAEPTYPLQYSFSGLIFKWFGTFNTSTTGGIKITDAVNLRVSDCTFWGLGGPSLELREVIMGTIERNVFKECLNTANIIDNPANTNLYCISIRDNFFQFTSPGKIKDCIFIRECFNMMVENNAIQKGAYGLMVSYRGRSYGMSVKGNFFEENTVGMSLAFEHNDGFYGGLLASTIENNVFTGIQSIGIEVVGIANNVVIKNNQFESAVLNAEGIKVSNNRYQSLTIDAQDWFKNINPAKRVTGFAYPNGVSGLDATKVTLDRCDGTSGWSISFNPSGLGQISAAAPLPGSSSTNSLQLTFSGTPTDQLIAAKTISSTDISNVDTIVVPFWIDSVDKLLLPNNTTWHIVGFGSDASNLRGLFVQSWTSVNTSIWQDGWNLATFKKADVVVINGSPPALSNLTYVQVRLIPKTANDNPVIRFGGIYGYKVNGAMSQSFNQVP